LRSSDVCLILQIIISEERVFLMTHVHGQTLPKNRFNAVEQHEMTEIEMVEIVGFGIQDA